MHDLEKAHSLLETENYTCVLCRDGHVITDRRRRVPVRTVNWAFSCCRTKCKMQNAKL